MNNNSNTNEIQPVKANSSEELVNIRLGRAVLAVLAVVVVVCVFCFPSSAQLLDSTTSGRSTLSDAIAQGLSEIAYESLDGIYSMPRVYTLPIDLSAGSVPIEENYVFGERNSWGEVMDGSYKDETIEVQVWTEPLGNTIAHYALVKISHPSQFRTALSGKDYNSTFKHLETPYKMAVDNNAVVAMNADFCNYNLNGSLVIKGGVLYKYDPKGYEVMMVDSDGNFHFAMDTDIEIDNSGQYPVWNGYEIYNSFSFGPVLVRDGQAVVEYEEGTAAISGMFLTGTAKVARAAIGQVDELTYLICIVDGTRATTYGVKLSILAEALAEKGCISAYNMDGGHSATLVFGNNMASHPASKDGSGRQRSQSDIIYFASALSE